MILKGKAVQLRRVYFLEALLLLNGTNYSQVFTFVTEHREGRFPNWKGQLQLEFTN